MQQNISVHSGYDYPNNDESVSRPTHKGTERQENTQNRNQLVKDNMPLVYHIAKKFKALPPDLNFEDFVQEGMLGLIHAAGKFDSSLGVKFGTYAGRCITAFILNFVGNRKRTRARKFIFISGDAPAHPGEDTSLFNNLSDEAESPEECVVQEDFEAKRAEAVHSALRALPERERIVTEFYFLQSYTLEQIGAEIGVTRERVRQIKEKALTSLRGQGLFAKIA